ncbi:redox-sensitive bicupin YhaK (pirin superfamily) [Aequitasia blattaphilus]|uniref:Pirin family protein n=1 Tax=Aequitasia blattaphilus TaxID=2949332 RepID=A0ABT1EBU6_9FIRM|nr:pirin family protein [Aequitasia blattaphilus]MCP1103303.1 pirin family protein [Aequitasia blattaphilus]MCR8615943.1 pirin family protein [Aequitasia blattaphilus]
MIRYLDSSNYGRSNLGWLNSRFHFSFAGYYNPDNIRFGALRVMNDDLVQPGTGFDTHPHKDMEIISYVVDGELTHKDSMGNEHSLSRGQVQYMSAGTGVYHSEYNHHDTDILRFLQIWILPDQANHAPNYGDFRFNWEARKNAWLPIASGDGDVNFPIQIHQDIHMYATEIDAGKSQSFIVNEGRQAYLVLIEGAAKVGDINMKMRDALEITEESITIEAEENAHFLIIEMKKDSTRD